MDRVLDKKAAARARAAPAPTKKKQARKEPAKPSATGSTTSESAGTTLNKKRNRQAATVEDSESEEEAPLRTGKKANTRLDPHATNNAKNSPSGTSSDLLPSSPSPSTSKITKKAVSGIPSKPAASKPRTGHEVVVFDASKVDRKGLSTSSSSGGGTEFSFKKFMSSKISKLDEAPPPMENPLTAEEKAEELENKKNDVELHSLIKASRLLEQYNADQLDGADRRRHQLDQLVSLGVQKKEKVKVPLTIGFGMIAKKRERDLKELEEAKNNGTYHKSIKHTFAAAGGKKKEKPRSERGLKTSMGRFKNGMLTLTEKEIKSVQREGVKKKAPGKKSGGKSGGGGGGKKKKGKGRF
ncbi:hypothetical protein BGZ58_008662 [Dissophora ornata]|nr:hypothetical protein BGZ58_008662 [Dissophora ornata]